MKEKQKRNFNIFNYYNIIFICVIIIEIFLVIYTSKQLDNNKIILKTKLNTIINKKNNISKLKFDNEKLEKEIILLKDEQINNLQLYQKENDNFKEINKNLTDEIHKNYEEYKLREKIIEYKIDEDNETLNELKNQLNNKTLIMKNLEKDLDKLEEIKYVDIPNIKMKSSILELDEEKINLITKI